jgi:hypothetical protein
MQLKALAMLGFMALTVLAQKCEKGNNHNEGGNCHGATGNLACSHNLKHVVSTISTRCIEEATWLLLSWVK